MIDLKILRDRPEEVLAIYRERLFDEDAAQTAQKLLEIDARRREVTGRGDELKQKRNTGSSAVGKEKDPDKRKALIAEMEGLKGAIAECDAQLATLDEEQKQLALRLPNLPDASVPTGKSDAENKVAREEGTKRTFAFEPKPHWEIGEKAGWLDFARGVKLSGTRFYLMKGDMARLQRALVAWMIDVHVEQGYTEIYPPYMVKSECLYGTAQLPKFADTLYRDAEEDFTFIPTAEVPVTNMYRDEVLPAESLPVKHVAFTACFRREKMAAGRDTRGIKRGHQFDKVEMVKFVAPEESLKELDKLVSDAEEILKRLEIPYRLLEMVTADLSFAACKKYDLEAWAPGCSEWLEVSSCSTFGDFQARRAMIRMKSGTDKPRYLHTLNGSGLALPRTVIAILENYQRADGSVEIPKVLRPYFGGRDTLAPVTAG